MQPHVSISAFAAVQPDGGRADGFRPAPSGGNARSGALLLVEAYAAIWLIVFAMVIWSLRRQGRMNRRIERLERQLAQAQAAADDRSDAAGDK